MRIRLAFITVLLLAFTNSSHADCLGRIAKQWIDADDQVVESNWAGQVVYFVIGILPSIYFNVRNTRAKIRYKNAHQTFVTIYYILNQRSERLTGWPLISFEGPSGETLSTNFFTNYPVFRFDPATAERPYWSREGRMVLDQGSEQYSLLRNQIEKDFDLNEQPFNAEVLQDIADKLNRSESLCPQGRVANAKTLRTQFEASLLELGFEPKPEHAARLNKYKKTEIENSDLNEAATAVVAQESL